MDEKPPEVVETLAQAPHTVVEGADLPLVCTEIMLPLIQHLFNYFVPKGGK